jgi:hypothetical protein
MKARCLHVGAVLAAVLLTAGCTNSDAPSPPTAPSATPVASEVLARGATANPCTLLADSDVRKVFPDAKTGQLDRSNEKYGILTCIWDHPGGRFSVQRSSHALGKWENESQGLIDGFIDPLNRKAKGNVRFEPLADVGDRAVAIVERSDQARGVLSDIAQLVVQVSGRQVTLFSNQLPQRERPEAIGALDSLGRAVAQRL